MKFTINKNARGFQCLEFTDYYGASCSLQKSSLAGIDAIWLGVTDANPCILASKTKQGGTGWVPYEIPEDVLLTTRMHLTREHAAELIRELQYFVDTGTVRTEGETVK